MVEVREMVYRDPTHPLQALLGPSQTAFCASPRQAARLVSRWLMISTDNTHYEAKLARHSTQYYVEPRRGALLSEASSVAT